MQELSQYNPEPYIPFQKEIRFHPKLSFGEKIFYAELSSMSKSCEDQRINFSSRKLCKIFGVSHQTALNWIKNLIDLDLLEVGVYYTDKCKYFMKVKPVVDVVENVI